jgi:hypothetical protein
VKELKAIWVFLLIASVFQGGQHSLAGEGAGEANSDDWRESLALCILFGPFTKFKTKDPSSEKSKKPFPAV